MTTSPRPGRTINSAMWAAWLDALGFMTELATEDTVEWRTGSKRIENTTPWRRRIGGRFGVVVDLPEGVYSDDTQLRLATSRAIRASGEFDVDAFSKIELPVWGSYALGAGRASRAASANLGRSSVTWLSNYFQTENAEYTNSGGNGGAMRVQPHVWSSPAPGDWPAYALDVIRNVVTTHGHPRALVGALFHAATLGATVDSNSVPEPQEWGNLAASLRDVFKLIENDAELNELWRPQWERATGRPLAQVLDTVIDELTSVLDKAWGSIRTGSAPDYYSVARLLDATNPDSRGSAIETSVLANVLAWLMCTGSPAIAIDASNLLGSDTDSIGTMAGAIAGYVIDDAPPGPVADRALIRSDAEKLARISLGEPVKSFIYPDLLHWRLPRAQTDFVGSVGDGQIGVAGLGLAKSVGQPLASGARSTVFRWLELRFGQRILIRTRQSLKELPAPLLGGAYSQEPHRPARHSIRVAPSQAQQAFEFAAKPHAPTEPVEVIARRLLGAGLRPDEVGLAILRFAELKDGVGQAAALAALLVAAIKDRRTPR